MLWALWAVEVEVDVMVTEYTELRAADFIIGTNTALALDPTGGSF